MATIDYQPYVRIDGEDSSLIVMEPRSGGNEKDRMKKIESPPNVVQFKLGSKIECFGKTWLVTEVNYNEELKLQGVMRLCNFMLVWQHPKTLETLTEWCVCSKYRTTASGEDPGKTISTNSTRRYISIHFNKITASLRQTMRHYVDINLDEVEDLEDSLKTYKLTDLDRTTGIVGGKGVFYLTHDEDQKQDDDRPDLGICNYKEPKSEQPLPIGYCEITYSGEPVIKVGGSSKRFVVFFKDNDGNTIDSIEPNWEIIAEPEISHKIVISSQLGNEIRLMTEDNTLVGVVFVLKVTGEHTTFGYFENQINCEVVDLW